VEFKRAEDLEFWLRLRKQGYNIANLSSSLLNFRVVDEMGLKRDRLNFIYNRKARVKNISLRYLVFDMISIMVSSLYCMLPENVISKAYNKENKA
jgi:hypothetical protein